VEHDVAGRVAVHNVVDPETNVTVPVAPPGRPEVDSVTAFPYAVELGLADAVMLYPEDWVMVKLVDAVDPL
jgi:hypothetical protein